MKTFLRSFAILTLGLLGSSSIIYAACDGSTTSCNPAPNGAPTATITTINVSVKNSATSTPNVHNSVYFFEATVNVSPSDIIDGVNGTVVWVGVNYLGTGNVNDAINGVIDPVVGGTPYNIFAQACPPGASGPDTTGCSVWVSLGSIGTSAYPANPGFLNVAPADTAPRQFTARTSSVQDSNDVLAWELEVVNDDPDLAAGNSGFLNQQPFSGQSNGTGAFSVTSGQYPGLLPNVEYSISEYLIYHYNKSGPTWPNGQASTFFTQPVNPVPGAITNVTHCSATLAFSNAAANPANPADSTYLINVGGTVQRLRQRTLEGTVFLVMPIL